MHISIRLFVCVLHPINSHVCFKPSVRYNLFTSREIIFFPIHCKEMKIIPLTLTIALILALVWKFYKRNNFFAVTNVCPQLEKVDINAIREDTLRLIDNKSWIDWPEYTLYDRPGSWRIFPFMAFGIWSTKNCKLCPGIYNSLLTIPGLKTALLSRMEPRTVLTPHQGWGNLSNYILRCHLGVIVPPSCYISVKDFWGEEKQTHHEGEWIIFDDSKMHYACNGSSVSERIVLIVDVERPPNIPPGKSTIVDSEELTTLVDKFRESL